MMPYIRKLHKWVGLLIGLQVFLWLLSGLTISLLDPARVNGQFLASPARASVQTLPQGRLLEPNELSQDYLAAAHSVELGMNHGEPVYRISRSDGVILLDATSGEPVVTRRADAASLARQDYSGDGAITSITRGVAPDMETRRHQGEYWRVNFSDDVDTSLYISAVDGRILERRNDYWRVRDFFWMLHTMDYPGRDNFNNALVISTALIAIWLGLSGLLMLFDSFNRHDFYFLNVFQPVKTKVVTLVDPGDGSSTSLKIRQGANLFVALAEQGTDLPSVCGGGGDCGKCRVRLEASTLPEPNPIERGLIPSALRKQGYRLACQHHVAENLRLYLPKRIR